MTDKLDWLPRDNELKDHALKVLGKPQAGKRA